MFSNIKMGHPFFGYFLVGISAAAISPLFMLLAKISG